MATTTNLGLFLPTYPDYVDVERDIKNNMQKIDDAFTPTAVEYELGSNFTETVTVHTISAYRFGKLVSINGRLTFPNTATTVASKVLLTTGLPVKTNVASGSNVACGKVTTSSDVTLNIREDGALVFASSSGTVSGNFIFSITYMTT